MTAGGSSGDEAGKFISQGKAAVPALH